jgi:hypothetical protein
MPEATEATPTAARERRTTALSAETVATPTDLRRTVDPAAATAAVVVAIVAVADTAAADTATNVNCAVSKHQRPCSQERGLFSAWKAIGFCVSAGRESVKPEVELRHRHGRSLF